MPLKFSLWTHTGLGAGSGQETEPLTVTSQGSMDTVCGLLSVVADLKHGTQPYTHLLSVFQVFVTLGIRFNSFMCSKDLEGSQLLSVTWQHEMSH